MSSSSEDSWSEWSYDDEPVFDLRLPTRLVDITRYKENRLIASISTPDVVNVSHGLHEVVTLRSNYFIVIPKRHRRVKTARI